jgi:protein phosphatase
MILQRPTVETPSERISSHELASKPALVSQSFGLSDRGKERPGNEDQFLIATLTTALRVAQSTLEQNNVRYADGDGQLLVVADGIGGHLGGAEASALAVGAVEEFLLHSLGWLFALGDPDQGGRHDVLEEFKTALRRADASVCEAAASRPDLKGMGTTLTMAFSLGATLFIAHVGDSRCYLYRARGLHQLTRDHTLAQDLVETGVIPPDKAPSHDFRHVVTNAVGGPSLGVRVEVHSLALQPNDVVLLCTDGLTEHLSDGEIADVLRDEPKPRRACEELVRRALDRGGYDNITVLVSRFARAVRQATH